MTNILHRLWRYLLYGSDELVMPQSWLADTTRLRVYVGYTYRQLQQGSIVKDTAQTRRDAFWARVERRRNMAIVKSTLSVK
jgi:hypothetical protein